MPRYNFRCPRCDKQEEVIRPMADAEKPWRCPGCNVKMARDFQTDLPFASGGNYKKPIISDSLAVSANQVEEHRQLFPDVKILSDGRPVFENFQQHNSYLKKTGFYKKRQRTKPKAKRIA